MFKKINLIIGLIILLQSNHLLSQYLVSEKWYGGSYNDVGYGIVQMDDDGFLITGIYQGSYYNDIYLIKTDPSGDALWSETYGGSSWDNGTSIISTFDNNYLVAGRTFSSSSTSTGDAYLLKVDADGNVAWDAKYGSSRKDGCFSVIQASDSGYVFTGQLNYNDFWVLKTDSNGVQTWSKTYTPGIGYRVMETPDHNFLVTGSVGDLNDIYIAKLNPSSGDTIWTCVLGGSDKDYGYALCNTYNGGYLVLSNTNSYGSGGYDIYLAEISSDGDTLSTKTIGMAGNEYGYSISQTPDSGYIICGSTNSKGAGLNDVYVVKLDTTLDSVWTATYGGANNDWAHQILCVGDSNYVVIGSTESHGNSGEVYFLKISENLPTDMEDPADNSVKIPGGYTLSQNYPNPFNPSTKISFTLPKSEFVEINLFNLNGQSIRTIYSAQQSAGLHEITVNAENLASGVYFYRIEAGTFNQVRKMILLR